MDPLQDPVGVPFIRDGDTVYLLDLSAFRIDFHDLQKDMLDRLTLSCDEYECPFNFLTQFDMWFEWQKRVHFDKQTTGITITRMLHDRGEIIKHKIERRILLHPRFDYTPHHTSYPLFHTDV